VLYDSRCEPPPDAVLKPGYIGYEREKQLKRYFPGCVFAASSARFMNWASARIFPRRATHRERWRLPNRVQWP
jgi:hypothetical protein